MKILHFPDPHLFKKCKDVTVFGPELSILLNSMWDIMVANKGVGLASNQVSLDLRMFAMKGPNDEKLFIVNPVLIKKSVKLVKIKEGCLSAPGEFVEVLDRPEWVEISFKDETGKDHKRAFFGLHSVCVLHEIEHLDGLSFMESKTIPRNKRKELAKKWFKR